MFIRSIIIFIITTFMMILNNIELCAQGITRSNGIGLRAGFWNITKHRTRITTTGYGKDGSVGIGGAGGWIYFFSRIHNNLFLELNLGGVGGVYEQHSDYVVERVKATAIVPLLLGFRYDLLSPKMSSSLQPYITLGCGPYWITEVQSKNKFAVQV